MSARISVSTAQASQIATGADRPAGSGDRRPRPGHVPAFIADRPAEVEPEELHPRDDLGLQRRIGAVFSQTERMSVSSVVASVISSMLRTDYLAARERIGPPSSRRASPK